MKISANAPCPCGREAKLKHCCGRYHQGRPAAPEALVRARYCAYVLGRVRFIIDTTHPTAEHYQEDRRAWKSQLVDYCRSVRFEGLTLTGSEVDEAQGRAWVSFSVQMVQGGAPVVFTERSTFIRDGNRWRYAAGDVDVR